MDGAQARRARNDIRRLAAEGLDWVTFSTRVSEIIRRVIPFDRACWHTVDPGTVLFTGTLSQNVACSGAWLAEHEFVIDDVNKWWFLARSGRHAGATSLATHGQISRSPRHRSHRGFGIGDELRGSFVSDGTYWGAVGLLRNEEEPWYTEDDVRFVASLSEPLAEGFRRALLAGWTVVDVLPYGPGVIVFDSDGRLESISPAAEHWVRQLTELPAPSDPGNYRILQVVAARARAGAPSQDPLELSARCRAQTASGSWLLLYGTRLSGGPDGRTAVIIQPAAGSDVAPLVALAYGLSDRESQVARLCIHGQSTKQMAETLRVSPYTVQDHLKSIFEKTGVRTRGELVGQVFLEHYVPRWEDLADTPPQWQAKAAGAPWSGVVESS